MRTAICLLVSLAVATPAMAAPSLDDIMAKNAAAHGGDKLTGLQSLRLTGNVHFGGGDFSVDAAWGAVMSKRRLLRSEVTLQGLTQVRAYDGKTAWKIDPFGGRREPERLSADDAKAIAQPGRPRRRRSSTGAPRATASSYLGTEDVDGTPAHKLRVTRKDGDVEYVYLDPDSFLEIRVTTIGKVRGVEQVTETDLGGYEQVGRRVDPVLDRARRARARRATAASRSSAPSPTSRSTTRCSASRRAPTMARDRRGPRTTRSAIAAVAPATAEHAPRSIDSGTDLRPRRAQHRLGGDERPRRGGRRRATRAARRRSTSARPPAACGSRSTAAPRSSRCSTSSRCSRSARSRSIRPNPQDGLGRHRRGVDAQLGVDRRRHLQVDRRRRDVDEHGPARVRAHRAHPRPPEERQRRLRVRARQAVERQRGPRRLQDDRRRQDVVARARGREPLDRLLGPHDGSEEPRRAVRRACGTSAARAGRSAPAATGPTRRAASGLFRTADGGKTWTHDRRGEQGPARRAVGPRRGRVRAVATRRSSTRSIESKDSALYRSERRRRDLGAARQQPEDGVAPVLLRAPRRRSDEPGPAVQARPQPDRQRGRRQELLAAPAAARTATGTTSGSIRRTPSTSSAATTAGCGSRTTAATAGGRRTTCPISQFYHVSVDDKDPYQVYGGLQDNSSWVGDSAYPGRHHERALGEPLRRRRLLGDRRSDRSGRGLRRVAGRLHRARRSQDARVARHPAEGRATRRSCASTGTRRSREPDAARARSTSARSSCSARATAATPGSASRRI